MKNIATLLLACLLLTSCNSTQLLCSGAIVVNSAVAIGSAKQAKKQRYKGCATYGKKAVRHHYKKFR